MNGRYYVVVACYHEDGTLDERFGSGGITITDVVPQEQGDTIGGTGSEVVVSPDGHLVVLGTAYLPEYASDFVLARYLVAYAPQPVKDVAETPEDAPLDLDVLANDTDQDGDALVLVAARAPAHGTAVVAGNRLRYTPAPDFFGTDSLAYTVRDGDGEEASATVIVTVTPVNDAPAFTTEPATVATQDVDYRYAPAGEDPEGDPLEVAAPTLPGWLALRSSAGTFVIEGTPGQANVGEHTVVLELSDGSDATRQAFTIVVSDVNLPPEDASIASPGGGTSMLIEGSPDSVLTITWEPSSDPDGDEIRYRWELAGSSLFSPMLAQIETGTATYAEISYGALGTLLSESGIGLGGSDYLFHRVVATDREHEVVGRHITVRLTRGTLVAAEGGVEVPGVFTLRGNYPNPFNPSTQVAFDLPEASVVRVEVVDLLGRQVLAVPAGQMPAGFGRTVRIDASALSSGAYLYRVVVEAAKGRSVATGRMMLVR